MTVEKKIIDAVAVIANENRYHPVCDFLNALQWDGTERIRFCLHRFLGSDTDDYTYEALKLFLLGAISRAFQPGCKFEVMDHIAVTYEADEKLSNVFEKFGDEIKTEVLAVSIKSGELSLEFGRQRGERVRPAVEFLLGFI